MAIRFGLLNKRAEIGLKGPTEHTEQSALCKWLDREDIFYFAIPNGGRRDPITARMLKREGVKPGAPDLFFPGFKLFIEMKDRHRGKPSPAQIKMMNRLRDAGYRCEVCEGAKEAHKIIKKFI